MGMYRYQTILMIDDSVEFCEFVRDGLERSGRYRVVSCNGGDEGIRMARYYQPALIILDINMPGMDGGMVAAALRENRFTCSIPIVFLTGLVSLREMGNLGSRIGGETYLAKPIAIWNLVSVIDSILGPWRLPAGG